VHRTLAQQEEQRWLGEALDARVAAAMPSPTPVMAPQRTL
jgi:hypothetical protein